MVQQIQTSVGKVHLRTITSGLFASASKRWPMGFHRGRTLENEDITGIVFQRGSTEQIGLKFQQVDHPNQDARLWTLVNGASLASSLRAYQSACFGGIMVAGVYLRPKGAERSETGFAFFPIPDAMGLEARKTPDLAHIDGQVGRGSSMMAMTLMNSAAIEGKKWGLPQLIDIDIRPRSAFGGLRLDFLLVGGDVVVLRRDLSKDDPFWEALAQSGTREFFHMPSVAATVEDDSPRSS